MTNGNAAQVVEHYDRSVDDRLSTSLREGSLFFNFGYWHDGATSLNDASERLMAELTVRSSVGKGAAVLDVACGMGATTRYIADHTDSARVVGINISGKQLEVCRENMSDLEFLEMSATEMEFKNDSFDNIFCIEAAFHFNTRKDFLIEARRILKTGGRLAMTDIPVLVGSLDHVPENRVDSMHSYSDLLTETGFKPVTLIDRSKECIDGFVPFILFFRDTIMQRGELSQQEYWWLTQRANAISQYTYLEVIAEAA